MRTETEAVTDLFRRADLRCSQSLRPLPGHRARSVGPAEHSGAAAGEVPRGGSQARRGRAALVRQRGTVGEHSGLGKV